MPVMRCGTCHRLMVGNQEALCKSAGHEAPYDDEAGEGEEE